MQSRIAAVEAACRNVSAIVASRTNTNLIAKPSPDDAFTQIEHTLSDLSSRLRQALSQKQAELARHQITQLRRERW